MTEKERTNNGVDEHRHNGYEWWHPVSRVHAKLEAESPVGPFRELRKLSREEDRRIDRIIDLAKEGAVIRMYEPCNCGDQVRHNNGGNYHQVIHFKNVGRMNDGKRASSGSWYFRAGNTCELIDFPEWEDSSYSDCITELRYAIQDGWEITIDEYEPESETQVYNDSNKVYIWEGFEPDFTGGMALVIAGNSVDAKKMLVEYFVSKYGYFPKGVDSLENFEKLEDPEEISLDKARVETCFTGGA